jgi:hypothetical protein
MSTSLDSRLVVGIGTNNYAEMMALHLLLKIVMDKGVMSLQIYGILPWLFNG